MMFILFSVLLVKIVLLQVLTCFRSFGRWLYCVYPVYIWAMLYFFNITYYVIRIMCEMNIYNYAKSLENIYGDFLMCNFCVRWACRGGCNGKLEIRWLLLGQAGMDWSYDMEVWRSCLGIIIMFLTAIYQWTYKNGKYLFVKNNRC